MTTRVPIVTPTTPDPPRTYRTTPAPDGSCIEVTEGVAETLFQLVGGEGDGRSLLVPNESLYLLRVAIDVASAHHIHRSLWGDVQQKREESAR